MMTSIGSRFDQSEAADAGRAGIGGGWWIARHCAEVRLLPGPCSTPTGRPPRRTSRCPATDEPVIATRPSERTGDVATRIPARGQGAQAIIADRGEAHKPRPGWFSRRGRCVRSAGRPIPSPAPRVIRCGPGAPAVRPSVCEVASAHGRVGRPSARRFLRVARPRRRHPTERHHLGVWVRICFHEAGWPVS
jgi:hypothetical protein